MIFEDNKDYLCYVEAVHLLMHENIKKKCNFVHSSGVYKDSIYNLNFTDNFFLRDD